MSATPQRERRRPGDDAAAAARTTGDRSRAALLDATLAIVGTGGWAAASVGAVAGLAGVAKPTVLYHFGTIEALWEAALGRALASWWLAQAEAGAAQGDPRLALDAWLAARFDLAPASLRARWLALSGPPGPLRDAVSRGDAGPRHALLRLLVAGDRACCWATPRPEVVADVVIACTDGMLLTADVEHGAGIAATYSRARGAVLDIIVGGSGGRRARAQAAAPAVNPTQRQQRDSARPAPPTASGASLGRSAVSVQTDAPPRPVAPSPRTRR